MNKQQFLQKILSTLAKKLPAVSEPPPRSMLEEVLFGIIRENLSPPEAAEAYERFFQSFFDLNEIRVSTILEVADALAPIREAGVKAERLIKFLQEHFERTYSFDFEDMDKKRLKLAAKQVARYKEHGVTDFVVAWFTQRSLQGHALPLDEPTVRVLHRLQLIENLPQDEDEFEQLRGSVEHMVPKALGVDFTDRLSQLAGTHCTEKKPNCAQCPVKNDCPSAGTFESSKKSKTNPTNPTDPKAGETPKRKPKSR